MIKDACSVAAGATGEGGDGGELRRLQVSLVRELAINCKKLCTCKVTRKGAEKSATVIIDKLHRKVFKKSIRWEKLYLLSKVRTILIKQLVSLFC